MLQPVFLIGFMGAGKSSLGKKLALLTGVPFLDLDQEVIETTGKTIAQWFSIGEMAFREAEKETLLQVIEQQQKKSCIIATGGGTPCFFDNLLKMNQVGITVYLKLSAEELQKRLAYSTNRPLLPQTNQFAWIQKKLEEREPFYSQARLIVNAEKLSANQLFSYLEPYECFLFKSEE
ncbi:MAG: shikimate kinase [Bacteroidia bacterium]|nr:shikimate kinase [Bacteroidia bacterium]